MTPSQIRAILTDYFDFAQDRVSRPMRKPNPESIEAFSKIRADEVETEAAYSETDYLNEIIELTGVDPIRLQTDLKTRIPAYVLARQLHCYVMTRTSDLHLRTIGKTYNKAHCTIIHGNKKINNWRRYDPAFRKQTKRLFEMLEKSAG
jgi:hypothetical protein